MWNWLRSAGQKVLSNLFSKRFGVSLSLAFALIGALSAIIWGATQLLIKAMGVSASNNALFQTIAMYSLDALVGALVLSTVCIILSGAYWMVSFLLRKAQEEMKRKAFEKLGTTVLENADKSLKRGTTTAKEVLEQLRDFSRHQLPPPRDN